MNYFNNILLSTTILIISTLVSFQASAALAQYSYTGNLFDSFSVEGVSAPYNVDRSRLSRVRIDFAIEDSLVPKNTSFYSEIDLTKKDSSPFASFYISDGYTNIDHYQIDPYRMIKSVSIMFDTDSEGNVDGRWRIVARSGYYTFYDQVYSSIQSAFNNPSSPDYEGVIYTDDFYGFPPGSEYIHASLSALVSNGPGSWTRTLMPVSNVPLPNGMLLFLSALCCLCFRFSQSLVHPLPN
ncbi:hypothetical protein [Methylomonas sp. Kb3]|uniref:hypothetical protein n=1 Tax=Methylomonas sp. Kb3 TaxID=1611544 RepID=UPI001056E0E0|nr:hypothetical protein [Methylomonas sp. Kb3]